MPDMREIIDRVLRLSVKPEELFEPICSPERKPSCEVIVEAGRPQDADACEPGTLILPFRIERRRCPRRLRVEVLSRFPREARIWLEMPGALADLNGISKDPAVPARPGGIFVPVNPNGQTYFREASFPRESAWRLVVEIPPALRTHTYEMAVRVLEKWEELYRVTWRVP
jgi:hypothetical protein